ncbi:flagellar assembly peptidoglycan hydrolase FlgJ [Pseudoteredinibacter isoporae]|uniref:Peptidoglycan hydrolase FlgJ n=1 Tax=Pseudoteredinibacter isoporae TaxID=570281 RepID=A0A7X0JYB5_9GAMM|nr:flagellar assembly peptidoglycan hydrolase FlgJ [Pseudoteredinibacter isoporae]MBB6523491.1 flagellar protein FlgJ [Pseudoteredinibacter isoporae]NHO89000.1 flagellar assembly peptidoglycan hydrolase FlgJ [Pseudoteredinibacter isoporae]NIB24292.1 flagellar assembly peptidoglycan hydrolase FlgJ [Pseudoteredinibacter isoporae]
MKNLDTLSRPSLANAGVNYNDLNSLNSIKQAGRDKDPESLRKVAQQFEAMFIQTMLKTMRQTNEVFGKDNFLNSSETALYQGMLDDQMSLSLSNGRGLGLADAFFQQMNRQYNFSRGENAGEGGDQRLGSSMTSHTGQLNSSNQFQGDINWQAVTRGSAFEGIDLAAMRIKMEHAAEARRAFIDAGANKAREVQGGLTQSMANSIENFIEQLAPAAKRIANYLGVEAKGIIAQAALETGWGQHIIQDDRGQSSFNLFNIKARGGEPSVAVNTLEYRNGQAVQEKAEFRKYNNIQESFNDYARLLKENQRYESALAEGKDAGSFAEQLQQAGYATDPNYADKIKQILQRQEFKLLDK